MELSTLADLKAREKDARRQVILNAAIELFATRDFKQVTVRQIASQAGLGVGTIYNYYASLDELFLDIFLLNAEEIISLIDAAATGGKPSLVDLCRIYINYLNDNMTFYQMMSHFMLAGNLDSQHTDRLNKTMRRMLDHIETIVQTATGPRPNVQPDARLLAHALFSALNGVMISYARYPGRDDTEIKTHTRTLAGIIASVFAEAAVPNQTDPTLQEERA